MSLTAKVFSKHCIGAPFVGRRRARTRPCFGLAHLPATALLLVFLSAGFALGMGKTENPAGGAVSYEEAPGKRGLISLDPDKPGVADESVPAGKSNPAPQNDTPQASPAGDS